MRSNRLSLQLVTATIMAATGPLTFAGQPSPAAQKSQTPTATPRGSGEVSLNEVVVTAQRRQQSILSVPVAVTAVSAQTLKNYNLDNLTTLGEAVPQLKLEKAASGSGAVFSIRGIGSSPLDSGIPQSVLLDLDGTMLGQGNLIEIGLFDLKEVQVLKGPQALFFGKNSSAGVVVVASNDPGQKLNGYAKVNYEFNAQEKQAEAAVGGPVTSTFGARVAVRYDELGGWVQNDSPAHLDPILGVEIPASFGKSPEKRQTSARVTLQWKPTDNFEATLISLGDKYWDNGDASVYTTVACAPGQTVPTMLGIPDVGNSCTFTNRHAYANAYPAIEATNIPWANNGVGYSSQSTSITSLKLVYTQPLFAITEDTSYTKYNFKSFGNFAASAYPYFGGYNGIGFHDIQAEARLASSLPGRFNFQIGVFIENNSLVNTGYRFLAPFGPDPLTGSWFTSASQPTEGEHTQSAFFEGRYEILSNLELSAGARYTHDTSALEHLGNSFVHAGATFLSPAGLYSNGSLSNSNWSPAATLKYTIAPDRMLYVAYKTGFKAGTFGMPNVISLGNTPDTTRLKPEKSKGYEVGFKGEFLDHRLRTLATLYTYDFDDLQTVSFDAAAVSYVFSNAAAARTRGAELQTDWLATSKLELNADLAYNQARYLSYANAQCYGGEAPSQCVAGVQNLSGVALPYASDWIGVVGGRFNQPIGENYVFTAFADINYQTRYNVSEVNIPAAEVPGYALYNVGFRFGRADGLWDVGLLGKNLSNRFYPTAVNDSAGGVPGQVDTTGVTRPREIWLKVSTSF